jgi:hypothetical protein
MFADRVLAPDMEAVMRAEEIRFGLEQASMRDFDMFAISPPDSSYTQCVEYVRSVPLPLHAKDRDESYPW